MIGKLTLLSLLALAQSKPYKVTSGRLSTHNICPTDLWHHLIPHEYDCTQFYYCEYGVRRDEPTSCALGTEFSAALQVCIQPALANCQLPGVSPEEEVDNGNEGGENKPEVPESVESLPESVEQNPDVEEENLVPEEPQPESEEQKPEVEEQEPEVVETTPKPAEIQPESEEQKPESGEENNEIKEVESVPIEPQPESEEKLLEIEEQEPPQGWLSNGCPADIHVHWLLPHERECDKFYYCNFGETVLTACAPGTYFNFEIQVCDWPENVNCANSDSGSGDNGNSNENDSGDNEGGSGDKEGGSGDKEGGSGDSEEGSGDNADGSGDSENGIGDSGNGSGDSENSGDGWLPNGCPIDSDVHYLLPHQTECGKFYQCAHGVKVVGQCEGELQFNPILQVCDYPENVGCEGADDNENNGESHGNSEEKNVNTEENSVHSNESIENNEENDLNDESELAVCPSDFNIHLLLPHEADCSKFYNCNFGNKVVQLCPSGLHFNPEIQVCDWPWNVNCEM